MKSISRLTLSIAFIKQGKSFVAFSPALDLSTVGKSEKEAKRRFEEAVDLFFDELDERGTLTEVLQGLGWERKRKEGWNPPHIIGQSSINVRVPVGA